jgi:hypothetical protein
MFNLMDAPHRGALMLVRVVAAALIGWSILELSFYWVVSDVHQTPVQIFPCVLKSIPFLFGVIFLIKSKALADWISDRME